MDKYKEKLKEWYEITAEKYDTWGDREGEYSSESRSIEIQRFNALLDLIEIGSKTRILDVATGTGMYLIESLKRGGVGYGVDISKNMLEQFKKKINQIKIKGKIKDIKEGDAEQLSFQPDFFDVVICIGLFDYYPLKGVRKFLKEIRRVLKRNGKLIVDFPNMENKAVYEFQEKERSVGHDVYICNKDKLINFLNENDFRILKYHDAGIEVQFLLRVKK